jgi:hypothetical protein
MKKKHFLVLVIVAFAFSFGALSSVPLWVPQANSLPPLPPPMPPPPPPPDLSPPPPPPDVEDCSQGFFKNHVDAWCGECSLDGTIWDDCSDLEDDLRAKGKHSNLIRDPATQFLNECFDGLEFSPCADD